MRFYIELYQASYYNTNEGTDSEKSRATGSMSAGAQRVFQLLNETALSQFGIPQSCGGLFQLQTKHPGYLKMKENKASQERLFCMVVCQSSRIHLGDWF